jgi:hypothetical protein
MASIYQPPPSFQLVQYTGEENKSEPGRIGSSLQGNKTSHKDRFRGNRVKIER